jgi:hypothetical protein
MVIQSQTVDLDEPDAAKPSTIVDGPRSGFTAKAFAITGCVVSTVVAYDLKESIAPELLRLRNRTCNVFGHVNVFEMNSSPTIYVPRQTMSPGHGLGQQRELDELVVSAETTKPSVESSLMRSLAHDPILFDRRRLDDVVDPHDLSTYQNNQS